jgi:acetylornithine/succinyldiaminopimelate/putrescine aminotransferase
VAGRGVTVTDENGTDFLDLTGQTLTLAFGHLHPRIATSVADQLQHLWFASSRFGSRPTMDLAKLLVSIAPTGLTRVNLKMCDGSDAVETAIKLARLHTRAMRLLCVKGAWHGETSGTLGLCSFESGKEYVVSERDVSFSTEPTLESVLGLIARSTDAAAVIIDPVGVSNGLFLEQNCAERLRDIRELCDKKGIMLIFDEVQTFGGFLGSNLFASDYFKVTPDLLCLGKALGGGLPLAATLCRTELGGLLDYNNAEFTYGGQALACAAGLAALNEYLECNSEVESNLRSWSNSIDTHLGCNVAVEIRRFGFITTITRREKRFRAHWTRELETRALQSKLIVRRTNQGEALLMKPPIIISATESEVACERLAALIEDVEVHFRGSQGVRVKLSQANKNKSYVDDLLRCLGSSFGSRLRTPREQEIISEQLGSIGVPVNKMYSKHDRQGEYWHEPGQSMDIALPEIREAVDYPLVNALLVRQQNALEMAHAHSIVIGDRWPGNSIVVNENKIVLIDFDIQYEGNARVLYLFEEMFSLFHCLAHVGRDEFLEPLASRFLRGIARRFTGDELLMVWHAIARFYSNPSKEQTESSLPPESYYKVLTVFDCKLRLLWQEDENDPMIDAHANGR